MKDNDADGPSDLIAALEDENETLRTRVAELEAATAEYRRQMTEVLTSASWRGTAAFRGMAGTVRLARRRARQLPRRLVSQQPPVTTPTTGLFPPAFARGIAAESPLLFGHLRHDGLRAVPVPRPVRPEGAPRVVVVAHVFYPEVWPDIEDRLSRLPEAYDLIVCLVQGRAESLEQTIMRRLPHARIHHQQNYGRDLGSLIELANLGTFHGYDAVLKVHTKRSPHRLDGDAWRVELLDGVLPSPEGIHRIIELLRRDPDVGLVCPTGHVRGAETWGSDQELVEALASRIPFAFDPDALRYPAGSMYWAKPWLLERLADLQLTQAHFETEADHLDGSTAHALERYIGVSATVAGLDLVESADVPSRLQKARRRPTTEPRVLAFYLPQYHQCPENDRFWGEGFTDWVNVDKAKPLFEGHRLLRPTERDDLSDPSVMAQQALQAREMGLSGFVVHHYWFDGRKVLDLPMRNILADPSIDFPFALCWANEPWTRSWDGLDGEVLIPQSYEDGYADAFYDDVLPYLQDPRYLRVNGRPLLVIYRAGHLRNGREAILRWKQRALEDGLNGLCVLGVLPSRDFERLPASTAAALDGLLQFPPGSGIGLKSVAHLCPGLDPSHSGDVYSYDAAVDGASMASVGEHGLRVYPGVMPGWDNTARRDSAAYVFHGSNPLSYHRWLRKATKAALPSGDDPLVFVNAWNEWAEGAALTALPALPTPTRQSRDKPT